MKKIYLSFILISFITISLLSQTPQAVNYQAIARDDVGNIIADQDVSLRISVLEGSAFGTVVYSETHVVHTNLLGLLNIEIGNGSVVSGSFPSINWGSNTFFIKTEMDPAGGSAYALMGTSQLLSVPYSLFSENTANVDDADADPGNEIQTLSKTGSTVTLSDGGGSVNDDVDDADNNPANELQTLSKIGSTIELSDGGGTVNDDVDDADNNPANELQTLSKVGINVTLSNGGGTVSVADNDNNASNELQTLTKVGSTVTLSNGGGSFTDDVNDADHNPNNEFQTISKVGSTVTLSNSGGSFTDAVNDADANPANELQNLSLVGNNLSITNGNNVNLPTELPVGSAGKTLYHNGASWLASTNIFNNGGNVGIGTINPTYPLHAVINTGAHNSRAIYGVNESTGTGQKYYGVRGDINGTGTSNVGAGVFGYSVSATGSGVGIKGETASITGRGLFAWATHSTGVNYGVYGHTSSPNGYGGYFRGGRNYFEGNVGIGTTNPAHPIHIFTSTKARGMYIDNDYDGTATKYGIYTHLDGEGTGIRYGQYNYVYGNSTDPSASYGGYFYVNPSNSPGSCYGVYSRVYQSGTGNHYAIYGYAYNGWAAYFPSGDTYIGGDLRVGWTADVPGYLVAIDGKVMCEELRVELSGDWPDYVFDKDYNLMPLNELEKSIIKNKHLPGLPSANKVKADGIMVGDMTQILTQKVEELTLYIIELNKKVDKLEKENQDLRK